MIITSDIIKDSITCLNKNTKLSREVKNKKYIKIKNGLYETDPTICGYYLAGAIYGPSYLSFEFTLSYYGLIPERVYSYTSATYNKKKKKEFINHFGRFLYRDVPNKVYSCGVTIIKEGNYYFQIATKEKALCDKLYTLPPIKNMNELKQLLFNDLRIYEDEFFNFDLDLLKELSELYGSTNVTLLYNYLRRRKNG